MITFSTTLRIRTDAGFYGNPDVSDDVIDSIREQSYGIVLGIIAGKYDITHIKAADPLITDSPALLILERAEILIASGTLLNQEYGAEQMGQDYDGDRKIKEGKSLLMQIFDSKAPTRLIGSDGLEFPMVSIASDSGEDGIVMTMSEAPRAFTVDQVF